MNPGPVEIRTATPDDAEAIAQLVNSAYRGDASRKGWTTEADFLEGQRTDAESVRETLGQKDTRILLAFKNAVLVGCVTLEKRESACYLGMLTISPRLQAQGFGRLLLEESENFARRNFGATRIEMTVIPLRHELIAWYERRGYKRTGQLQDFPGYENNRFGRPLRPDLSLEVLFKNL